MSWNDDLRAAWRQAGLFAAVPWAVAVTGSLLGAPVCGLAGVALVERLPLAAGLLSALAWLLYGVGVLLVGLLGLSGHVTTPASRVAGGVAAGLAGAVAVAVAGCGGLLGAATEGRWLFVGALLSALLAAPAAAAWARLRYDATPTGATVAGLWALALGGGPVMLYGISRVF